MHPETEGSVKENEISDAIALIRNTLQLDIFVSTVKMRVPAKL